jgi:hypothetical protein
MDASAMPATSYRILVASGSVFGIVAPYIASGGVLGEVSAAALPSASGGAAIASYMAWNCTMEERP